MLARLDEARRPERLDMPGFQLHTLRGDLAGSWSITVRAIWRIIFRVERGDARDADLVNSQETTGGMTMTMKTHPNPSFSVRHNRILTITEAAEALGETRQTLNNLVNGKSGVSADMAIFSTRRSAAARRRGCGCKVSRFTHS